jgi:hypothetical protein
MLVFPGWDGYWINKPLRNEVGRNFILEKIRYVAEMDGKAIVKSKSISISYSSASAFVRFRSIGQILSIV